MYERLELVVTYKKATKLTDITGIGELIERLISIFSENENVGQLRIFKNFEKKQFLMIYNDKIRFRWDDSPELSDFRDSAVDIINHVEEVYKLKNNVKNISFEANLSYSSGSKTIKDAIAISKGIYEMGEKVSIGAIGLNVDDNRLFIAPKKRGVDLVIGIERDSINNMSLKDVLEEIRETIENKLKPNFERVIKVGDEHE